jgi:DNA-binding response OmpR family regulator
MQEKTFTDKLILVVDDEPLLVSMIKRTLESEGFRVMIAGDGVFALTVVRENNPDLVLLDVMMPGPDGLLTLERIREISSVPVIMLTGARDENLVSKSMDGGADDFVRKPFRMNELLARINAKLRRNN